MLIIISPPKRANYSIGKHNIFLQLLLKVDNRLSQSIINFYLIQFTDHDKPADLSIGNLAPVVDEFFLTADKMEKKFESDVDMFQLWLVFTHAAAGAPRHVLESKIPKNVAKTKTKGRETRGNSET